MPQLLSVMLFALALASPCRADQVLGPYTVDLPDDLYLTDCEDCTADQLLLLWKPVINAKTLAAYYDDMKTSESDDMFGEALSQGVAGHIDLFYWPREEKQIALTAKELHAINCTGFKAQWGYGISDFDQTRKFGYCATAAGAMVYVVCRYDEGASICASGLDYIELGNTLIGTQHTSARSFLQAWKRYETDPTPQAERDLLKVLRPAGNIARIEDLLGRISLRNGN